MKPTQRSVTVALSVFALDNLCISVVLPIFAMLILNPTFAILPADIALPQRYVYLGMLIAAFPVAMVFGAVMIGYVADRKGRRFAFLTTLTGELIGAIFTIYAFSKNNYNYLVVGRVVSGFFAGNITICLATLADISAPGKSRASYFGVLGALSGVTFVFGVLLGGLLSNATYTTAFSPTLVYWIITGLTAFNWLLIAFFFQETAHTGPVLQTPFGLQKIYVFYTIYFFAILGWFILIQFLNADTYIRFHGTKQLMTFMIAGTGVIFALGTGILGRMLIKICAIHKLILTSLFFTIICLVGAGKVSNFLYFLFFYFISVMGVSFIWIGLLSFISSESSQCSQGKIVSANQAILALCMAIAPILGGFIAEQFTIRGIYYSAATSTGIAFLLYILFVKRK
jgi:MFS transporter, DHA1 family, tetracycline resistance protein